MAINTVSIIRNNINFQDIFSIVETNSKVVLVTKATWVTAADIKSEIRVFL